MPCARVSLPASMATATAESMPVRPMKERREEASVGTARVCTEVCMVVSFSKVVDDSWVAEAGMPGTPPEYAGGGVLDSTI